MFLLISIFCPTTLENIELLVCEYSLFERKTVPRNRPLCRPLEGDSGANMVSPRAATPSSPPFPRRSLRRAPGKPAWPAGDGGCEDLLLIILHGGVRASRQRPRVERQRRLCGRWRSRLDDNGWGLWAVRMLGRQIPKVKISPFPLALSSPPIIGILFCCCT